MKIQDWIFIAVFIFMIFMKKDSKSVNIGLLSLVGAIFLYVIGNIFTAGRFVVYAAGFLLYGAVKGAAS